MRAAVCAALALFVVGVPSPLTAAPIAIDFEAFADGDLLSTQIPGLTFSDATVWTAGISLVEFEAPPRSGVNAVFGEGGLFQINFADPIASFGAYFTYLAPLAVTAYDAGGTAIGTALSRWGNNLALSGDAGSTPNELFQFALSNISYVTVSGGSFVLDDLSFDDLAVDPIPEPGTFSLMLLGAGAAAVVRRRTSRRNGRIR